MLKNEQLKAYFIFDQQSPYFRSTVFLDLLQRLSEKDKNRYVLKEEGGKLCLSVNSVRTVKGAYNVIHKL